MTETQYKIVEVDKGFTIDKSIISINSYIKMCVAVEGEPGLRLKSIRGARL